MKKSILVLSALLTLVVSGICLQSCSSEYDEYTTEEYGYYTEEEIAAIESMAQRYGLNLELNREYYGPKKSLWEHENEMIGLSFLLGEHEIKPQKGQNGRITYTSQKNGRPRTVTRFIEGEGSWSGSQSATPLDFTITVTISWSGDGTEYGVRTSGSVEIAKGKNIYSKDERKDYSSAGSITTRELGLDGIGFEGSVSYAAYKGKKDNPKTEEIKNEDYWGLYQFSISGGQVSTTGGGNGTFIVTGSGPRDKFK